ncbi:MULTISPECIES: MFS transporter [Streptomyces]|uniref:Permease of the major facilitator superfamily n=1 Tax=Streptomyces griseus subsp. griseus (strain JCM 4626 / CBS 651.72 / NBRC 13350 / KCC S-0626 / ISP 5235) TaxID=455632 RepID=B1VN05_STRGG|nr:MFS transporter [Streptomyces griseus]BAG23630.1 putative permease of the major facilitator superfamily [Streptomyces griseus subsp. griseus NBRC 13350]SEE30305.1 Predicted arabinose efflux permease, MFS family [Streptomyces griseus]SQA25270.1 major facilitator superfamily permease [Streptomyces griseus]
MNAPASAAPARPAHRDGNVLRWLTAYTASVTGDVVYFLALSWAATRAGGPSQVGLVVAAGALPRAVLMLAGGVVADRFGPRRVAVVSDAVRCVVILIAAVGLSSASPSVWLLVAVALVFGVVDAVFMPAVGALPPRITAPAQLARVQGMRGLSIRLSNAVGPVLAGSVLLIGGAAGAFTAAAALFALSLVTLLTVRITAVPQAPRRGSAGRELMDGLRYVRRHRMLAPLVTVVGLSEMCFSGPVATGLVLLADERGWGASGMGWIASAFSVGAAASALLLTVSARIPRAGLAMSGALLVTAAGAVALGHAPSLPVAVLFGSLIGLTSGFTTTVTGALVQTETDPRYLGRVTSVTTLCTLGLAPALFPAVGVTVALWGADTFFIGCGVICLSAAVLGLAVPVLRRAEIHPPDSVAPAAR